MPPTSAAPPGHGTAPPIAPQRVPLLGHLPSMVRDPFTFLSSLPGSGDLVEVRLGPARAIVVCTPELTRHVLLDDRTFDKGGLFFDRLREVLGDGLGTCPHSRHRRKRRLSQPAFHKARMPGYADVMTEHITDSVRSWRDRQVLDDVYVEMMRITSRVTLANLFSSSLPPGVSHARLLNDITTVFDGWYWRMLTPPPLDRLPTPGNRRYQRANARLRRDVHAIVTDRRASIAHATGSADHSDLLSALLTASDTEGASPALSDTEIVDLMVTFLLGGTETTATTLAWALHLLAHHPDVERALHTEVDAVLVGGPATRAELPRLELTGRVITETLRIHSPTWILTRTTTTDTELGGYRIPQGTTIVFSPYLLHRRADLHHDPDRFDPDRWLPERNPPTSDSFIPFGSGARTCIGDTFAITQATLALATIASRWTLRPVPGPAVTAAKSAVSHPRDLRMRINARR
ncbi:cytochrome P450 [Streptomyces sp. G45]|uniref:cytochrome P450 n=1 Tax=Streptomyces sp. G45 TaxID=3406627 RepID=UPI003C15635B